LKYHDILSGKIDDPQAYAFAKFALEEAVRYGPRTRDADTFRDATSRNTMINGEVNTGSENDFRLFPDHLKVVHGEARGVYPQLQAKPPFPSAGMLDPRNWDSQSLAQLQQARADMARVVENRNNTNQVGGVNQAELPNAQADPPTQTAGNLARQAVAMPSNLPPDVMFFYLRGADPKLDTRQRPPFVRAGKKPVRTYGPFLNSGGGDVKSKQLYIDFYTE
jgi:hypothetical protein